MYLYFEYDMTELVEHFNSKKARNTDNWRGVDLGLSSAMVICPSYIPHD